jgi:indolepyruvate ferredoxin oxidoreductase beta subunit
VENLWIISATDLAIEAGNAKVMNMTMIGALVGSGLVPMAKETFSLILKKKFQGDMLEVNMKAFQLGVHALKALKD